MFGVECRMMRPPVIMQGGLVTEGVASGRGGGLEDTGVVGAGGNENKADVNDLRLHQ